MGNSSFGSDCKDRRNSRREVKGLAADSSGFKNRQASLWRFLKWSKGGLRRTSTLFSKLHLIIALPSRATYSLSLILVVTLTTVKPSEYCGKNYFQRF
ncbi:MAG: hypothetical protein ACTSYD_13765 [Candidatus Heimdallarchaeaceae archaeon]